MPTIGSLTSFTANTLAQASQVNSNFSTVRTAVNTYCAFLDASSQTFTGNQTFNPTSGVALTVTDGGITVSADGITVTGNSTITGTLGGVTTLSCTTVTATNLGGTLTTAAQPNVTSLGTIASLVATAGTITTLTFTTATPAGTSPTLRTGSTDFIIKNNAGSTNVARFLSAGGVVLSGTSSASVDVASAGSAISITAPSSGVYLGAIGTILTTATGGFPIMPDMAGNPSGSVADGYYALDSTNHRFYVRSGGVWKYAALT